MKPSGSLHEFVQSVEEAWSFEEESEAATTTTNNNNNESLNESIIKPQPPQPQHHPQVASKNGSKAPSITTSPTLPSPTNAAFNIVKSLLPSSSSSSASASVSTTTTSQQPSSSKKSNHTSKFKLSNCQCNLYII